MSENTEASLRSVSTNRSNRSERAVADQEAFRVDMEAFLDIAAPGKDRRLAEALGSVPRCPEEMQRRAPTSPKAVKESFVPQVLSELADDDDEDLQEEAQKGALEGIP